MEPVLSLHLDDHLSGIVQLQCTQPVHMRQVKVYLEGEYTVLKSRKFKKPKKLHQQKFVVQEHTLWTSTALPDYTRSEGEYVRGENVWPFTFDIPVYNTVVTKYFTLVFNIRAEIVTSTLIFNTFGKTEPVTLVHYKDSQQMEKYHNVFNHVEGPFAISLSSRVLDKSVLLSIKADLKYSLTISLVQAFQYEIKGKWLKKSKQLCTGKMSLKSDCFVTVIPFQGMTWKSLDINKDFAWNQKYSVIETNTNNQNENAGIDHYLEIKIQGKELYQLVIPLLLIK